jgi:hypothetical protein
LASAYARDPLRRNGAERKKTEEKTEEKHQKRRDALLSHLRLV